MTNKKNITIGVIVIVIIVASIILYFSISDREDSNLEYNVKIIQREVGIDEEPAKDLADKIEELGLGRIKHLDVTHKKTTIELIMTNDKDEEYLISLGKYGWVFIIQENKPDGEYLFAILE
jgi:hypothetical protein